MGPVAARHQHLPTAALLPQPMAWLQLEGVGKWQLQAGPSHTGARGTQRPYHGTRRATLTLIGFAQKPMYACVCLGVCMREWVLRMGEVCGCGCEGESSSEDVEGLGLEPRTCAELRLQQLRCCSSHLCTQPGVKSLQYMQVVQYLVMQMPLHLLE